MIGELPMKQPSRQPFGTSTSGIPVDLLSLDNGHLSCRVITFGACLQSLYVPNRNGYPIDVVLGYDTLEEYILRDGYFGAVVGRYANRIAKGSFSLDGRAYNLTINNGPNHLHGGNVGFSHRVWTVEGLTPTQAVLTLDSPHGEEGYPGNLKAKVTYTLEGSTLSIRYQAQTDRNTLCNLTNHAYFNLAGHSSGQVLAQQITIHARGYTPIDTTSIPLGWIEDVAGSPMDLRSPTPIGAYINEPFPQLIQGCGYDHNYVLDGPQGVLCPAAHAACTATGIAMEVETTLPGLQFYTANFVEKGHPGKGRALYGPRHAFCLESQFFPDSPNHPSFPSSILRSDTVYDHITRFSFSTF